MLKNCEHEEDLLHGQEWGRDISKMCSLLVVYRDARATMTDGCVKKN